MMRALFALLSSASCAAAQPGLHLGGASSRWFDSESVIEGAVTTNRGHQIDVTVLVTGVNEPVHIDATDRDGRYRVRAVPPGKHVVHFLLPAGEQHVEVDVRPSQRVRIDAVEDESHMDNCCLAGSNDAYHPGRTLALAQPSCQPDTGLVGLWEQPAAAKPDP